MSNNSAFIILIIGICFQLPISVGDLESVFDQCCTVGAQWAQNHITCSGYPAPVPGIQATHQSVCKLALEICCIRSHRTANCEKGKEAAKLGQVCTVLSYIGGEAHKDCCEGCKLGLITASSKQQCNLKNFAFGTPWDESYYDCCIQASDNAIDDNSRPGSTPSDEAAEVDECALFPGQLCAHICVNTPESYRCECHPGFRLSENGKGCIQAPSEGRCLTNNPCQQKCIDTGVAIQCSCYVGFQLLADQRNCEDINECALGTDTCNPNTEECQNTLGGFQCIQKSSNNKTSIPGSCYLGYYYNPNTHRCEDTDECTLKTDTCNQHTELCINTIGSYSCIPHDFSQCPPGLKKDPHNEGCIDVDECAEGLHNCNLEEEMCVNSHGKYQCEPKTTTQCPAGFKFNSNRNECEDVNECEENIHSCDEELEICRNTIGGYDCDIRCDDGYTYSVKLAQCVDIDECSDHVSLCKPHEICINTLGSFDCMPKILAKCPPGYKVGPGVSSQKESCVDVDECEEELHSCDVEHEICVNIIGSYKCEAKHYCESGYFYSEDKRECIDINECSEGIDECNKLKETCVNKNGSYSCIQKTTIAPHRDCPLGYRFDVYTKNCEDINECTETQPCLLNREICINVPGSYRCRLRCAPGYQFNDSFQSCVDVDECAEAKDTCNKDNEICINTQGGYLCDRKEPCVPGFKLDKNRQKCIDIDECAENTHNCNLETHSCINIPSSFHCVPKSSECGNGYHKNVYTNLCEDINECAIGTHDCNLVTHYCVNTAGSYQCQTKTPAIYCDRGYIPNPTTRACVDIDECTQNLCLQNQKCENTLGSYRCICHEGFNMDPLTKECKDINECQVGLHNCVQSQRCDNTIGSFTCVRLVSCGTGYTLNAETGECEDDDECRLGTHNCGPSFTCRNTEGSFRCDRVRCAPGQKLLADGTCQLITCPKGMEPDSIGNCIDINECVNVGICRQNQRCINTVGSYRCQNLLTCGSGYEVNEYGNQCVDIDECARGTQKCGANQICRNKPGGYICECPVGYIMNPQRECEDLDECVRFRGQVCSVNAECQNTVGSYLCNCKAGFRPEEDTHNCLDVDECAETPNLCHQKCINIWGSYQCTCEQGYTLEADSRTCKDIDECALWEGRRRLCIGFCNNEPGSYSCSCPDGYRLSGDKRNCHDINECEEQKPCYGDNEVCLNVRGGYKCNAIVCPPNYIRDPDHRNKLQKDATVLCRKHCRSNDIDCVLNNTQTLTYQSIAIPSIPVLPSPVILTTMRAITRDNRLSFNTDYVILEGNRGKFDVLRGTGVGSLRLIQPITGPLTVHLKLEMLILPNQRGQTLPPLSRHLAFIQVIVSQYEF